MLITNIITAFLLVQETLLLHGAITRLLGAFYLIAAVRCLAVSCGCLYYALSAEGEDR
jgi:hypothetical protein